MKKNTFVNIIALIVGIYFIIRGFFWFTNKNGEIEQNKFIGIIYISLGILAIIIQIIANYRNKNRKGG